MADSPWERAVAGLAAAGSRTIDRLIPALRGLHEHIERVKTAMARAGLSGIVKNLGNATRAVKPLLAGARDAAKHMDAASACLVAVPDQATPQHLADALRPVAPAVDDADTALATLAAGLTGLHGLVGRILHGGQPGPLQTRAVAIAREVAAVRAQLAEAKVAIEAAAADVQAAGDAAGRAEGGSVPSPDLGAGRAALESVGSAVPVPSYVQRIAASLRVPAGSKTAGVLCGRDGRALHDPERPLVNGKRGGIVDNAATLRDGREPPWKWVDSAKTHVEGHAAGLLREPHAPSDAVLVITRPPCADVPFGCRYMLPNLLPADSQLHVYVVGKDGQPSWFDTYHGNGSGVKPQ